MANCSKCEDHKKKGHNYCRHCGNHLTKGFSQNARVGLAYNSDEGYCGYCGDDRETCRC